MPLDVLLVGSDYPSWVGLHAILKADRRLHLVGEARTACAAERLAAERRPDAVLVAAEPPDMPVSALVERLRATHRAARLVVIGRDETLDGDTLADLLNKVSACLVWEEMRLEAVQQAVVTVAGGGLLVASPPLLERLLAALERRWRLSSRAAVGAQGRGAAGADGRDLMSALTGREREVAALRADGLSYEDIGKRLYISESTVKSHATSVRMKLDLGGREDIGLAYRRLRGEG